MSVRLPVRPGPALAASQSGGLGQPSRAEKRVKGGAARSREGNVMNRAWGPLLSASRAARLPATFCLLLLTGCTGERGSLDDPLRGGPAITGRALASGAQVGKDTPSPGPATGGGIPPLPSPYQPSSTAGLTASSDLRLRDTTGAPTTGAVLQPPQATQGFARASPPVPNPGASIAAPVAPSLPVTPLGAPIPSVAPAVTLAAGTQPSPVPANLQTANFEQLQAMLAARNVTWQRLELVGEQGDWRFQCAIPNPANKSMRRNYVATLPGGSGLPAIRAVIAEIDLASGRAP